MLKQILFIFLFLPMLGKAQVETVFRDSVLAHFTEMRTALDGAKTLSANKLENLLVRYYSDAEKFDSELDSVPFLGQISSADGKIKMLCWNLALDNGEFKYHCIIRHKTNKKSVAITVLRDNDSDWNTLLRKPLQPKNWYGALYYRIQTNKFRGKTYYTLLGWDGKNAITNRKIVDVLNVQGKRISLGANIFKADKRPVYRLVYEYANDVVMSLNFNQEERMIVMDHLAPEDSRLTGQFQFYGPDLSYDGLQFNKGKWDLITDIFANNKGQNNIPKDQKPNNFSD